MDIIVSLVENLSLAWANIAPLVIGLVLALFLFLAGLLVARGLGNLVTLIFSSLKLDRGAKQIGFTSVLEKGNIKRSPSQLLGDLVYWVVALVVIVGVLGALGLMVGPALDRIFAYLGIVVVAALILGIGVFLAGLVAGIVRVIMANFGLEGEKIIPRIIYYAIVVFVFLSALSELGFSPNWTPHIGIILGMPALAGAIAFGLGCKDMAADFLHNLFKGR